MNFSKDTDKENVFTSVENQIKNLGFNIIQQDKTRPWGGFFVIDENQTNLFIEVFFPHLKSQNYDTLNQKLSPKILIVAPEKRLSWQYHFRRSEIWKVIGGTAGVVRSQTDIENSIENLSIDSIIELQQGERHRLIGLDTWGIIAEIWQHSDPENPSDENDIVRVQDDFGR